MNVDRGLFKWVGGSLAWTGGILLFGRQLLGSFLAPNVAPVAFFALAVVPVAFFAVVKLGEPEVKAVEERTPEESEIETPLPRDEEPVPEEKPFTFKGQYGTAAADDGHKNTEARTADPKMAKLQEAINQMPFKIQDALMDALIKKISMLTVSVGFSDENAGPKTEEPAFQVEG